MTETSPPKTSNSPADPRLSNLVEVAQILNSDFELEGVMTRIMECAARVMNAEASSLLLRDPESTDLVWAAAVGPVGEQVRDTIHLEQGQGLAGWVLREKEPVRVDEAHGDPRFDPAMDHRTGFRTRGLLCAPLRIRGEDLGVAEVINCQSSEEKKFTAEDLDFFCQFCDLAAVAVQNSLLYQADLKREREQRDLELARSIQRSLLPSRSPEIPGYELVFKNQPALHLGGDFYDVFPLPDGSVYFCVGDACGKGIPAALYMIWTISDVRLLAPMCQGPGELSARLNANLAARGTTSMFVTLIHGFLDPTTGRAILSSAGHPPPIRLSEGGYLEVLEVESGVPLGVTDDYEYPETVVTLERGQALFCYTDGLVEARRKETEIGETGLLELLQSRGYDPTESFLAWLFARIGRFAAAPTALDDLTALVLSRKEPV